MNQKPTHITVFAPADSASAWHWVVDGNTGSGQLSSLAGRLSSPDCQVDLLVPADACLITQVSLPHGRKRDRERALPFVLEEQLAGDPAEEYLAYSLAGDADTEIRTAVAAIQRERLDEWLEALGDIGLQPTRICVDALNLEWNDNQPGISGLTLGAACLLRWGRYSATRCAPGELDGLLDLIDPDQSETLRWQGHAPPTDRKVMALETDPGDGYPYLAAQTDQNPLDWVGRNPELGPAADSGFRWRPPLLAAAAALAALLLWQVTGLWSLSQQAEQLQADIDQLMNTAFPGITTRVQGREGDQAMNALNQRRGQMPGSETAFLALLDSATRNWPDSVDLLGLELGEGELSLDVEAGAATELDALRTTLENQGGSPGLAAELSGVSLSDGRARAWLRIREAGRG